MILKNNLDTASISGSFKIKPQFAMTFLLITFFFFKLKADEFLYFQGNPRGYNGIPFCSIKEEYIFGQELEL